MYFVGERGFVILTGSIVLVSAVFDIHNDQEDFHQEPSHIDHQTHLPSSGLTAYRQVIESRVFHCVVSDLDGVVLQNGQIHEPAFRSLLDATLIHEEGVVPLVIASGRSYSMIESRVLPYIEQVLDDATRTLLPGEFFVFASNGAFAIDIASGDIFYDDRLGAQDLSGLVQLESVKTLLLLRTLQQRCFGSEHEMFESIPHYALDESAHTLLVGVITEELEALEHFSPRASELLVTYQQLFGTSPTINDIVRVVNEELTGIALQIEAWTSNNARFIGFQKAGVSKQRAIDFAEIVLGGAASSVLSIGDSPASNDGPLVYRDGGICNRRLEELNDSGVLTIDEPGDQWERVACLMKNATMTPFDSESKEDPIQ